MQSYIDKFGDFHYVFGNTPPKNIPKRKTFSRINKDIINLKNNRSSNEFDSWLVSEIMNNQPKILTFNNYKPSIINIILDEINNGITIINNNICKSFMYSYNVEVYDTYKLDRDFKIYTMPSFIKKNNYYLLHIIQSHDRTNLLIRITESSFVIYNKHCRKNIVVNTSKLTRLILFEDLYFKFIKSSLTLHGKYFLIWILKRYLCIDIIKSIINNYMN